MEESDVDKEQEDNADVSGDNNKKKEEEMEASALGDKEGEAETTVEKKDEKGERDANAVFDTNEDKDEKTVEDKHEKTVKDKLDKVKDDRIEAGKDEVASAGETMDEKVESVKDERVVSDKEKEVESDKEVSDRDEKLVSDKDEMVEAASDMVVSKVCDMSDKMESDKHEDVEMREDTKEEIEETKSKQEEIGKVVGGEEEKVSKVAQEEEEKEVVDKEEDETAQKQVQAQQERQRGRQREREEQERQKEKQERQRKEQERQRGEQERQREEQERQRDQQRENEEQEQQRQKQREEEEQERQKQQQREAEELERRREQRRLRRETLRERKSLKADELRKELEAFSKKAKVVQSFIDEAAKAAMSRFTAAASMTPSTPPPTKRSRVMLSTVPSSAPKSPSSSSVVVDVLPSSSSDLVVKTRKRRRKEEEEEEEEEETTSGARNEAKILTRVSELKKQGIWVKSDGKGAVAALTASSKSEPAVIKAHWGFVLEEMTWMASVFRQEVKAKKANARKCARMVQKHFQDKTMEATRAVRAEEADRRRVASFVAREVRMFWGNIEKLFEYKIRLQLESKRKQALDEHLNFMVDKTEKYSTLLAESMAEAGSASMRTTPAGSDGESVSSANSGRLADQEYQPEQSTDDDEATIGKEEDANEEGEIDMLKEESEVPLEELLKKFHPELYNNEGENAQDGGTGETSETASTTAQMETEKPTPNESAAQSSADVSETEDEEKEEGEESKRTDEEENDAEDDDESESEEKKRENLKTLVSGEDDEFYDAIEVAEAFQPTGNTLDTTTVKTPVPFLLKHTLREYQHIGLDWMVSLHARLFNGILADEMGLGKTIQTIALLAHLACEKGVWGPHLIVVPTSVMLNWEMELKKWCPGFKVLTYYGTQKERRMKRVGWTKPNAFHVCITSYKLVIQDHQAFRRKRWYYFILDEAQHIKNFKSQRWQLLLNFQSTGRLLLTGTPLQNNLMELWSLMHFLMPNVFQSHKNFKEWFSNPLTGMVEDSAEYNDSLVRRLHKVLRPFLLRRLKCEVEKQLPKKYEHTVFTSLSKRQRFLYDDFMSRAKTRDTLSGGNFMGVINVLMQLRKVCNHPNLFEPRPTVSPFVSDPIADSCAATPRMFSRVLDYDPLKNVDIVSSPLCLLTHEMSPVSAFAAHTMRRLQMTATKVKARRFADQPRCPEKSLRMTVSSAPQTAGSGNVGAGKDYIPLATIVNNNIWVKQKTDLNVKIDKGTFLLTPWTHAPVPFEETMLWKDDGENDRWDQIVDIEIDDDDDMEDDDSQDPDPPPPRQGIFCSKLFRPTVPKDDDFGEKTLSAEKVDFDAFVRYNVSRTSVCPLYGCDLRETIDIVKQEEKAAGLAVRLEPYSPFVKEWTPYKLELASQSNELASLQDRFLRKFHLYVEPVQVVKSPLSVQSVQQLSPESTVAVRDRLSTFQRNLQLPEARLIEYDCGKLQTLARLLTELKKGSHRCLIFTQMTRMLDILEGFLNYYGHIYLRLDGSTKVEQRQALMERFNNQKKYFVFILSTRSGGVGINLTGADTVVFYDSDWNPTMDAQAQDRCHRIGQTRDVHIYRLVSERTIEENILKKANQKRLLGDLAIEGGNFTTAHLKTSTIKDIFNMNEKKAASEVAETAAANAEDAEGGNSKTSLGAYEAAIASVEDNMDKEAMMVARKEATGMETEFDEIDKGPENETSALEGQLTKVERLALAFIEFTQADVKTSLIAAADFELQQQSADIKRQRMEEKLVNVVSDQQEEEKEEEEDSSEDEDEEKGAGDEDDDGDERDSDDDSSEEEEESSSEEEEEEKKEPEHRGNGRRRTRSRGDVKINLWALEGDK